MSDLQFRPVEFDVDEGHVAVTAAVDGRVCTAVIERGPVRKVAKHVPIGTRDASALSMRVDGVPVTLRPGPGRLMRGSYKVRVRCGETAYLFRPKNPERSRLSRDGVRLGDFEVRAGGAVDVQWHDGAEPTAADVAVGYALAAAFGTGAQFFLAMLLDLLTQIPD